MELKVLEQKKHRTVFELPGADHTFCNALKQELWNDEQVTVSTYTVSHPLIGVPKFVIESKGDVSDALRDAAKRLQKRNKDFLTAFSKL